MSDQLQQLFEYLLAVKNMTSPPIRDFRQYDFATYIEDFPKGYYLYGTCKDKEAWVEVYKPIFMPPPKPDSSFAKWLKTDYHDELKEPDVYEEMEWPIEPDNDHLEPSEHTFFETFESNQTRIKEYDTWLEKWYEWSEDTQSKRAIQRIYEELFSLFQRLERDGEACELALGQGILTWNQSNKAIIHPLMITRIELSFDPHRGKFALVPVQGKTVCEMDMLDGIKLPNSTYLNNLRWEINASNIDPHNQEEMTAYFRQLIHLLDPNGKLEHVSEKITVEEQPAIYNKQVLFLRKKSGHLWKEELENAISALKKGYEIPNTLKAIVDPESVESEDSSTHISKHDLLFPLPSNDVQQEIAKRLRCNDGVTVQGPPGTGKSHTIVNLISDLLAKGKRVLVTSQKERALRVLTEKLPEDIRSLCVSLSGGDLRSLQEIENSIRSISFQTEHLNVDKLMHDIKVCKSEWEGAKGDLDDLKQQLQQVAEKEQQQLHLDREMISRIEAARC